MNSDLSGRTTRPRAKMPFLGRTLDRGPTKTQTSIGLDAADAISTNYERYVKVIC